MKVTCPSCSRRIRLKKSRAMKCKCGHVFKFSDYFKSNGRTFLIDANIILYAINNYEGCGPHCSRILDRIDIATTEHVLKEIKQPYKNNVRIIKVKKIDDDIKELKTNTLKQPTEADQSLIQAAIDHPDVKGIITYDRDFKKIATEGLLYNRSISISQKFFVGNAKEFLNKYN